MNTCLPARPIRLTRLTLPALLTLATLLAAVLAARAAAPRTISFEGRLTTPAGANVPDGAVSMTFRLYTAPTGGTALWSETKPVTVTNGLFTTQLGDKTAFPNGLAFDKPLYLSVQVGSGTEMAPRQPLASVPYALALPNVTVDPATGWVGIGTTAPTGALDVRAGELRLTSAAGDLRLYMAPNPYGDDTPAMQFYSPHARFLSINTLETAPDNGVLSVGNAADPEKVLIYVDGTGRGTIEADVKNFREPNPKDPSTDIVYACPEGPEAAIYVRGTGHLVDGRATIVLPEHFRSLAALEGMTVQLTPRSFESKGLATGARSLESIEVGELMGGTGSYDFDYQVTCVRKDYADYQVIRPWDEVLPAGTDRTAAWQRRMGKLGKS